MKIGIVGAGVMGGGIAQVCALAGDEVVCYDVAPAALDEARTHVTTGRSFAFGLLLIVGVMIFPHGFAGTTTASSPSKQSAGPPGAGARVGLPRTEVASPPTRAASSRIQRSGSGARRAGRQEAASAAARSNA